MEEGWKMPWTKCAQGGNASRARARAETAQAPLRRATKARPARRRRGAGGGRPRSSQSFARSTEHDAHALLRTHSHSAPRSALRALRRDRRRRIGEDDDGGIRRARLADTGTTGSLHTIAPALLRALPSLPPSPAWPAHLFAIRRSLPRADTPSPPSLSHSSLRAHSSLGTRTPLLALRARTARLTGT